MENTELKTYYARRKPYRRWVKENHIPVTGLFTEIVPSAVTGGENGRIALQRDRARLGWTLEDIELIVRPMAETGHEPVGAMGNDATLASLSGKRRSLFDFFHQLFAQVTNPPIDLLDETAEHARLVKMTRPVLTDDELNRLKNVPDFPAVTLSLNYDGTLKAALDHLAADALQAAKTGAKILILSDRNYLATKNTKNTEGENLCALCDLCGKKNIPSLLAVAAVHKALTEAGLRSETGVVVESGEVREVHHFAVLLGFGATAINPYLALATVAELAGRNAVEYSSNYVSAVCKGIMKIMSKMGISTLRSYRSAKIFEAVGLGPKLMREYFPGVVSPVGGLELEDLEKVLAAKDEQGKVETGGQYRCRKEGEEHLWNPQRLIDFREAVRHNDYARFKKYTDDIDQKSRVTLRSQLEFRSPFPIPHSPSPDVEPVRTRPQRTRHDVQLG